MELYGKELPTWHSYAMDIGCKLNFPTTYHEQIDDYGVDVYLDWIRDLSWYDIVSEFAITIYDYSQFLRNERGNVRRGTYNSYIINKELVVSSFVDTVLPWWEHEVEHCVVGGVAKSFNVYLVE